MTLLGLVTAPVHTGKRNLFSNSVFDQKPPPGYSSDTRFVSAGRGAGDRDTVAQIDIEVWYPCGTQDATHTRRNFFYEVAPHSNTFRRMAMPLGPHNVNVGRQIHQLAKWNLASGLGRETVFESSTFCEICRVRDPAIRQNPAWRLYRGSPELGVTQANRGSKSRSTLCMPET